MKIRCNGCFAEYDARFQICPHCGYVSGNPASEVYCLSPGTELKSRYIVGNVIGIGGFGIIYKAWDKKLETVIAIKEYFPTRLIKRNADGKTTSLYSETRKKEYERGLSRFILEAKNLAKFSSHPNIVNLFEYFESGGTAYIIMEYLDGVTLDKYIEHKGNLVDVETAIQITLCVCSALADIHENNILHRDISPENIIICRNGTVKVIDLGAARFDDEDDDPDDIVIKPGYAPPEQYDTVRKQGFETDIYSVGSVMYTMLTGQRPMESTNRVISDKLLRPKQINNEIPEYLDGIVMKAMSVDQQFRYKSIGKLVGAIEKCAMPGSMEKAKFWKSSLGYIALGAIFALMAVAILFIILNGSGKYVYPEETIRIWLVSGSDISFGIQEALSDFNNEHPEIVTEVEIISSSDYAKKYDSAIADDSLPEIFDSTLINEISSGLTEPVKLNRFSSGKDTIIYKEFYDQCFETHDRIPVSFDIPVIYSRELFHSDDILSFSDISASDTTMYGTKITLEELKNSAEQFGIAIDPDAAKMFAASYGQQWESFTSSYEIKSEEDFISGSCGIYFSDIGKYEHLLNTIPGLFQAHGLNVESTYCELKNTVSLKSGMSKEKKECAEAIISYILSSTGQDTIHIKNDALYAPITKQAYDEYRSVFIDLEWILDDDSSYTYIYNKS